MQPQRNQTTYTRPFDRQRDKDVLKTEKKRTQIVGTLKLFGNTKVVANDKS